MTTKLRNRYEVQGTLIHFNNYKKAFKFETYSYGKRLTVNQLPFGFVGSSPILSTIFAFKHSLLCIF